MGEIKIVVIDFDGTALGGYEPYDRFPDRFSNFLDKISKKGILWATCTTWHPYIQDMVFKKSGLKSRPIRVIGRTSMECGLYKNGKIYLDAEWNHQFLCYKVEFEEKYLNYVRNYIKSVSEIISITEYFDYIFSLKFKCKREEITQILSADVIIKEKTYFIFLSDNNSLQIFPWYLSKGISIKKLKEKLKLSKENILIAGDGVNDLPMFDKEIADYFVCPDNSDLEVKERIKKIGGFISKYKFSDGVIDGINRIVNTY